MSEPHICSVTVSITVSEPHSSNSSVSGPHSLNVNVTKFRSSSIPGNCESHTNSITVSLTVVN